MLKIALEMKPFAKLIGAAALATLSLSVFAQSAQTDLRRGAQLYNQMCMVCHGVDGNSSSVANPSLAQQHPEYLVKQLKDYASGARQSAIMAGFASALSVQDKVDISFWLATQTKTPGYAQNKETVALGERIFRGGIANRQIPACMACHGPAGSGIPSLYPRLAGQHAAYTADQMRQFRSGARQNNAPMSGIARYMTDIEIEAVSDFIAGLR